MQKRCKQLKSCGAFSTAKPVSKTQKTHGVLLFFFKLFLFVGCRRTRSFSLDINDEMNVVRGRHRMTNSSIPTIRHFGLNYSSSVDISTTTVPEDTELNCTNSGKNHFKQNTDKKTFWFIKTLIKTRLKKDQQHCASRRMTKLVLCMLCVWDLGFWFGQVCVGAIWCVHTMRCGSVNLCSDMYLP